MMAGLKAVAVPQGTCAAARTITTTRSQLAPDQWWRSLRLTALLGDLLTPHSFPLPSLLFFIAEPRVLDTCWRCVLAKPHHTHLTTSSTRSPPHMSPMAYPYMRSLQLPRMLKSLHAQI